MDQDVANAIADLRMQLGQLRSALGVQSADEAEAEVMTLKVTVDALAAWAVTQGFTPPAQ